jgi:hypothetical protein
MSLEQKKIKEDFKISNIKSFVSSKVKNIEIIPGGLCNDIYKITTIDNTFLNE